MKKEYICIICPRGCALELTEKDGSYRVTGNRCKRGETYAINEYTAPRRMITTTVRLVGGDIRCLPVISSDSVPREALPDCLDYLYQIEVPAPVRLREPIVKNILGTGVDVLAARDAEKTAR